MKTLKEFINEGLVGGSRSNYKYETFGIYNDNGEETYMMQCSKEDLEALRPQFKGVKQFKDPDEGWVFKYKDMEDMLDKALAKNSPYYILTLFFWSEENPQGEYPHKLYDLIPINKPLNYKSKNQLMKYAEGWGVDLDVDFHQYWENFDYKEWEQMCVDKMEEEG